MISTLTLTALRSTTAETVPQHRRRRRQSRRIVIDHAAGPTGFTWSDRSAGPPDFARWAAELEERATNDGLVAHSRALHHLVNVARDLGLEATAADILADPLEPDRARLRALAVLVDGIANGHAASGCSPHRP